MKQPFITFFAVLLLFSTSAHAQSWCPAGATWIYNTTDPMVGESAEGFNYVGDTVLDGFVGQNIARTNVMTQIWGMDTLIISHGPDVVTRTEPGIVYYWLSVSQEWDTLHWFGAVPGDRWSPGWEQEYGTTDTYLLVADTGTMELDGVALRTLTVQGIYEGQPDPIYELLLVERIAYAERYFFPFPPYMVVECTCTLGCYSDDEIRYPTSGSPCALTLAVGETTAIDPVSWSVSPVPFQDHFTVRSVIPRNATVILLDMTGRELISVPFQGTALEMDPGLLPTGSYVLRMVDVKGDLSHRLVIKE
ncbi:MAG TPA: T9SS type A sorting domain-containing protein [Flavobacteriales bacterium]|nr:T9SS type A sorting domain-containing protein [Flavobacteriales bacterium]MBK7248611.1 T9SS type A sorting domain-containing protein [Flavobacteriales bacterium]MBK7287765.1 T9SS type A sorting domain-containing protein [Flavobacteriales bacterium]HQV38989.1 T9SS type A sorting domain-containing protein [Flavobacteriales bacterium]HQW31466.1 T9SS type A sorting domain-containing protein [Flavobacteriales bacterium]